ASSASALRVRPSVRSAAMTSSCTLRLFAVALAGFGTFGTVFPRGSDRSAMARLLGQEGLIVGSGAWRCRFLVEKALQIAPMVIDQEVQRCLRLAPGRQDPLDRGQGEGAVLHRPLKRRQDIRTR